MQVLRLQALTIIFMQILLQSVQSSKPVELASNAVQKALTLLTDPEVRVRLAVGDCLGESARILGEKIWLDVKNPIISSIRQCWVYFTKLSRSKNSP